MNVLSLRSWFYKKYLTLGRTLDVSVLLQALEIHYYLLLGFVFNNFSSSYLVLIKTPEEEKEENKKEALKELAQLDEDHRDLGSDIKKEVVERDEARQAGNREKEAECAEQVDKLIEEQDSVRAERG